MNAQHILPQILLRSWPFPRGTGWIVKRFFEGLDFTDDVTTVKTTDGFPMTVLPNEHIGRYLYLTGEFDRSTFEVLQKHARPGDTLLDIGANIGYMSACFLKKVPGSKVIAVEPQPGVVDLLRTNLKPFGDRAQVAPVALSDSNGEGFLQIDYVNRGASKLVGEEGRQTAKVEIWSPERLFEKFPQEKIDIIKMDVEGHEETVFGALYGSIARFGPRLIMFEDHTDKAAPTSSIGSHLRSLGYRIFGVRKKLTTLDFPPIESSGDCRYNDYIALRD
jgi:FkbM family methyltransferase